MKAKKIIISAAVILAAFILFICWYNRNFKSVSTTALSRYKIYLITKDKSAKFWQILNQGTQDMADLMGISYIWDGPVEINVEEQIRIFNQAVEDGADAIMLAASDPVRISSAVEEAKKKGVKIIYVDDPAEAEGIITIATDNLRAGRMAGENMLTELEANGIQSGSIGIIGVTPENLSTVNRERGFREVLQQDGRFNLLKTKYAQGVTDAAQAAAEEYLSVNPDLVGIFGTDEGATLGLGNAIRASEKSIIGIGFDITKVIEQMISDGILQAVMVQNPYTMGYLGMAETAAALQGFDTGPSFINTGVSVVTKFQPMRIPER